MPGRVFLRKREIALAVMKDSLRKEFGFVTSYGEFESMNRSLERGLVGPGAHSSTGRRRRDRSLRGLYDVVVPEALIRHGGLHFSEPSCSCIYKSLSRGALNTAMSGSDLHLAHHHGVRIVFRG
jgi:hypothetical protein